MVAAPDLAPDGEATSDARVEAARALLRGGRVRAAHAELLVLRDVVTAAHETAVSALLVDCHLAQGDLGAALRLGDRLAGTDDPAAHHARAEVAVALGETDLAVERFRAALATGAAERGLPARAGAAQALLRLGERAEAHELAVAQVDAAVTSGTAYDVAAALRVLATCDASADAHVRRVPRLREALDLLADVEADRLRAQVQTDLAGLLLLDGDREEPLALLRAAETVASREDLWPLRSRVRRLLERMGEAPYRAEAEALAVLTAGERRVAVLALESLTNRQIAEHLAVSVKAVEGHLSKVYRKLGVGSRAALVASFGR
jgi:DNA-binding NarL/FixJ family response regulator